MHKTNVMVHSGNLWKRVFQQVKAEFPDVTTNYLHVDAATIVMATKPATLDVIVTDNLFGDIITDLAAAVTGGIGLAASGNINPMRTEPSMFEPVHGSAPDIAGRQKADPTAAVLSVALMLATWGRGGRGRRRGRGHRRPGGGTRVRTSQIGDTSAAATPSRPLAGPTLSWVASAHDQHDQHRPPRHLARPDAAAEREHILAAPVFGQDFTDHMGGSTVEPDAGWGEARIGPYGPITLDPAAAVLHYAQEIFEGLKAYRHPDGSVWLFRPEANAARMERSCDRMALPHLPVDAFVESVTQLVSIDAAWVPIGTRRASTCGR